jgi:hypothetical protein
MILVVTNRPFEGRGHHRYTLSTQQAHHNILKQKHNYKLEKNKKGKRKR